MSEVVMSNHATLPGPTSGGGAFLACDCAYAVTARAAPTNAITAKRCGRLIDLVVIAIMIALRSADRVMAGRPARDLPNLAKLPTRRSVARHDLRRVE